MKEPAVGPSSNTVYGFWLGYAFGVLWSIAVAAIGYVAITER